MFCVIKLDVVSVPFCDASLYDVKDTSGHPTVKASIAAVL
jgi:hypothetical protein